MSRFLKSARRVSLPVLFPMLIAASFTSPAVAQCPWDGAAMCDPSGAPPYSMCFRNLASPKSCQAPVNNAMGTVCAPSSAMTMVFGVAVTQTNTADRAAAYCRWSCTTTVGPTMVTCRVDLADGLPIELMGFSIEDESEGDDSQAEGDAGPGDGE